jgi:hypothetical protein
MLFREVGDAVVAIPQPSHAWLSGQAMRAWGNAQFDAVAPFEDVCLGAEQHDIGWLTWEQEPTLNPASGRPHSFREMDVGRHTRLWSEGSRMALSFGRYPALLVSLHGSGLYRNFDAVTAGLSAASIVREFLDREATLQQRLIASLGAEPHYAPHVVPNALQRNRRLVSAVDRLSIAVCTALRDAAVRADAPDEAWVRDVPTAGATADLHIRAIDGDPDRLAVSPWPFADRSLTVTCEGFELPRARFEDQHAMLDALRSARRVSVSAELTPDDRRQA